MAAATAIACFAGSVRAHHPLEDTYDLRRTVTLTGVAVSVDWTNPHVRLVMEVKGATGETTAWSVELDPPNALARAGVDQTVIKPGVELSVDAWLAKDASASANAKVLRASDGTVYVASATQWKVIR
jgi:hypothetical protein